MAKTTLFLQRSLPASPARVFAAWTDPEKMARWFAAPETEPVHASADARVGGRYRVVMREENGVEHDASGVYREVIPNEKLVFTWTWRSTPERETLVTVLLEPEGEGTLLSLTHELLHDDLDRDNHRYGWSGALDKLAGFVISPGTA